MRDAAAHIASDGQGAPLPAAVAADRAAASRFTSVSVTYNSAEIIGAALRALPEGVAAVVVDNASRDSIEAAVREARPDARLVRMERNLGFGAANNRGASEAATEFLLILNPDLRLRDGALAGLAAALDARADLAAVAPDLFRRHDGETGPVETHMLSGACMAVRRAAFEAVGGFDENIFLYFEDDDLSLRLRKAGWKIAEVPGLAVDHDGGSSTAPSEDSAAERAWLWGGACAYFAAKHADLPEGRKAARKIRSYRIRRWTNLVLLNFRGARHCARLAAGAAAVRRHGPATMRNNAFTGGPARWRGGAAQAA